MLQVQNRCKSCEARQVVSDVLFRAEPGQIIDLRLPVNKFRQIVVPIVFGSLGAAFGLYPGFWSCAAMLATGNVLKARRGTTPQRA